jgi:hypothetical protein
MTDIFTARETAFRALMNGSNDPRSVVPGGVQAAPSTLQSGPISHECQDCSADEPCSGCGGNVSRQSAAYQALGWANAQAAGIVDPFWRAASVSQTLRDAPARANSAEWTAVESMVARVQDLTILATQGGNANSALLRLMRSAVSESLVSGRVMHGMVADVTRVESIMGSNGAHAAMVGAWPSQVLAQWNPPFRQRIDALDAPPSDEVYLPTDAEALDGAPMCCVDEFEYPVPGSVHEYHTKSGFYGPRVGWAFDVHAKYNPEYPCVCECCEFRQYYTFLRTVDGVDDDENFAYQKPDCLPGPPVICPGSRDPEHRYPPGKKGPDGKIIEDQSAPCDYKYHDNPQITMPNGSKFTMFWEFTGIIYDTCREWSIRAKQTFSLWSSGSVSPEGKGSYTADPPSDRPHGWKDHPDGTRTTY